MIRERLPRATVIMFWHIPWPNAERIGICPWRKEILEGMLGSEHPRFSHAAALQQLHGLGGPLSRGAHRPRAERRGACSGRAHSCVLIRSPSSGPCTGSIDAAVGRPNAAPRCGAIWSCTPDALLGVGVDRLDYTKGIEERLLAVELLLERHPEFRGRFSFVAAGRAQPHQDRRATAS